MGEKERVKYSGAILLFAVKIYKGGSGERHEAGGGWERRGCVEGMGDVGVGEDDACFTYSCA